MMKLHEQLNYLLPYELHQQLDGNLYLQLVHLINFQCHDKLHNSLFVELEEIYYSDFNSIFENELQMNGK